LSSCSHAARCRTTSRSPRTASARFVDSRRSHARDRPRSALTLRPPRQHRPDSQDLCSTPRHCPGSSTSQCSRRPVRQRGTPDKSNRITTRRSGSALRSTRRRKAHISTVEA
jgi:hypothetical protein